MPDRDLSGRTLGDYILREQIGEGGHAVVYRAEQPTLERDVVIKVLRERRGRSDASRERFLREAQLASRLDHPYAAHVYDFGAEDEDGLLWLAMERVHGITLGEWLETRGPMPLEQLVPLFECVAQVVHTAHEAGIIHRDLKPSNIMVIERGGCLFPKLLDFGIAKMDPERAPAMTASPRDGSVAASDAPEDEPADQHPEPHHGHQTCTNPELAGAAAEDSRLTPSGAHIGSMAYMSPEQWDNAKAVGPAADIYSLGVVVYQALTGRVPFNGAIIREFRSMHCFSKVPSLGHAFSADLDRVIRRALAKDPKDRHGNAPELASELRAVLQAQPSEQLRALAQVWDARARSPALLLQDAELMRAPTGAVGKLEHAYLTESQRRARRIRWAWRSLVALAAAGAASIAVMRIRWAEDQTRRAQEQARATQRLAEVAATQAELEQGRSALLHDEPEALRHLAEAYRHDRSPSTAFMLARAMQPRLAEQARFKSSSGRMWSAAFSPDGAQIVTTDDRNAQIWDARTYQPRFTLPHGAEVYQAVYSADATRLVTAAEDVVRIWDANRGALVHELARKRENGKATDYFVVAISPDGRLVSAMDAAGAVAQVWDAATGTPLAELRNDGSEFPSLAFSADGRWLATTGGTDVRVFDTQRWRLSLTIRGPGTRYLAFDPTSPRLLTGATTGDVSLWAIPGGARVHHLRELGEPISAVAFSPDGQLVAAASRDGAEQVWHAGSGELQSQLHPRHSRILAVEFDRTSRLVLAAGADGSVVVADAAQGLPVTVLEGPQGLVWNAHFDPSSRRVVGASLDGTARVWDTTSPYRRWHSPPMSGDCGIVTSPEPDRRFLAVGCRDHPTRVWDAARDQLLAELPSVSHVDGDFTSAFPAVSGAGDRAAIARGNTVDVYELPGGRLLRTIAHGAPINAVAFARTGRDLASGAIDGSLIVTRESAAQRVFPTASGGIDAVGFLPDGRVVAADARRRLRVYDPGGAVRADLELPGRVMSVRIEGTRLVTLPVAAPVTGNEGPPLLLDLERYRVIARLEGHVGRVFSARWVAGDQILTAGSDGTARLWDASTGQLRQSYQGSSNFLADATLTRDGLVIAGGGDGLLRFWDRASGRPLWILPAHKSFLIGVHVEDSDIVTRGFTGEIARWTLPSPERVIEGCGDQGLCGTLKP